MTTPEPISLAVGQRRVAALRHRDSSDTTGSGITPLRVLCLHGWLDNASSFGPLAAHLPHVDLVALDLPGHGESDHWPGHYSPVDMMLATSDALDALDWPNCHLMGHSLGGCIAPLLAVARPERVSSLVLIDAMGPLSEPPDRYPDRLQRVLADHSRPQRFESRYFDDEQQAVAARLKAARLSPEAATLIVKRQLAAQGDGYRWRFDPALRMASPHYLTEDHVHTLLASISCPTLCIIAEQGFLAARAETAARVACLQQASIEHLQGGHHLHMESPREVAEVIDRFLQSLPGRAGHDRAGHDQMGSDQEASDQSASVPSGQISQRAQE